VTPQKTEAEQARGKRSFSICVGHRFAVLLRPAWYKLIPKLWKKTIVKRPFSLHGKAIPSVVIQINPNLLSRHDLNRET